MVSIVLDTTGTTCVFLHIKPFFLLSTRRHPTHQVSASILAPTSEYNIDRGTSSVVTKPRQERCYITLQCRKQNRQCNDKVRTENVVAHVRFQCYEKGSIEKMPQNTTLDTITLTPYQLCVEKIRRFFAFGN